MEIRINHLIEGARQAEGLVVIIDVFRAFSLECWLYAMGAEEIRPVGAIEDALAWREKDPEAILIGERHGRKLDGFDFGNSPSTVDPEIIRGKRIIHTTSAGTQGVANAIHAEEILTGSFVNAQAIAGYIRQRNPEIVTLVCMGKEGLAAAEEDELCALYLQSLLTGEAMPDIEERLQALRTGGGRHFFDPELRDVFPEKDFWMCIDRNRFSFVIRIESTDDGLVSVKTDF
jgi:2-phosphosulfolactate phosphatase